MPATVLQYPDPKTPRRKWARNARESDRPNQWRGLVGAWMIWEGAGPPRDISGYNNHSALQAGAPAWTNTIDGPAIDFDGNNDHYSVSVSSGSALRTGTGPFSVLAYAILDVKSGGGGIRAPIGRASNADDYDFIIFVHDSNGDLEGWYENSTVQVKVAEGATFPLDELQLMVMTYDGGTLRLYRQAIEVDSVADGGTKPPDTTGALTIGINAASSSANGDDDSGGEWNGKILQTRVYNRALTLSEIREIHTDPWGLVRPKTLYVGRAAAGGATVPIFHRHYQMLRTV